MKSTKSMPKALTEGPKYTQPDKDLVSWFCERVELEKERNQHQLRIRGGGKLPNSLQKKLNRSAARKAELLDGIIFPSMANLIYFFDAIQKNRQLNKLFEKDIIDLLDPRYTKAIIKGRSKILTERSSDIFKRNNLARLIADILIVDLMGKDDRQRVVPLKDFRFVLLYQIMVIINDKMKILFEKEYGTDNQITKSALGDLDNVLGWLSLVASSADDGSKQKRMRGITDPPITVPH